MARTLVKHFLQDRGDGLFLISVYFWDPLCAVGRAGDAALPYRTIRITTACQLPARGNTGQPLRALSR